MDNSNLFNKILITRNFPFLKKYYHLKNTISNEILSYYNEYINVISTPRMALSFESSILFYILISNLKPQKILDLGSGFSSFVIRYTLKEYDIKSEVTSIDDNEFWLAKSRDFVRDKNLEINTFILWDDFLVTDIQKYDFISHDLGTMDIRRKTLDSIIDYLKPENGILLLDDMHKRKYREYVLENIKTLRIKKFDFRRYTLDSFGRFSYVLKNY